MYDEAIAALQKGMTLSGDFTEKDVVALGYAYEVEGIRGAWRWELEWHKEKSTRPVRSQFRIARSHALLGEKDQAFEWLENAYEQHYPDMAFVKVSRWWDNLRSDPPLPRPPAPHELSAMSRSR